MKRSPRIILLFLLALLTLPSTAGAAQQWTGIAEACGGYNATERGSGQLDAAGLLYLPCSRSRTAQGTWIHDNYIGVFDATGQMVQKVPLEFDRDGRTHRASDVAPSPDGSALYVVRYTEYTVYRFDRQADGRYRARTQAEWRLGNFPERIGGAPYFKPRGQFISTDGAGDLYLSAGLWTCQEGSPHCTDNAIVKYRPAAAGATYLTRFGRKVPFSWKLGEAHGSFGGVTVTANGNRVFVADINNSRVQRFDRAADGSYAPRLAFGMSQQNDPNRWGACFGEGVLAAPYDLALSPRGEVLVINTTCYGGVDGQRNYPYAQIEVQRYDQDGGVRGAIRSKSHLDHRVHGIAIDRSGNIHLPQAGLYLRPAAGWTDTGADKGGGGPLGGMATVDTQAPTLTRVTAPATTTTRTVAVTVDATDDVGVAYVQLRVDGVVQPWRAFARTFQHTLADRYGAHTLGIQVRDAGGNISAERTVTITRPAPTVRPPADPGVIGGGGGGRVDVPDGPDVVTPARDTERPTIRRLRAPIQLFRGRVLRIRVAATDNRRVRQVRVSTNGRWGRWQPLRRSTVTVRFTRAAGWKYVLVQVRDGEGNRSIPHFHRLLHAPRGAAWRMGGNRADRLASGRGNDHIDVGGFDKRVDRVSCGAGIDTVLAQPEDRVARNCERVMRVRLPRW